MVDVFSQWIGLYSTSNRGALLTNFFDVLLRCPWGCLVAAKKHIVKIRKKKFSIGSGAESNPLTEDLHHAVHISRLSCITKISTSSCSLRQCSLLLSPSQQTQYRILNVAYYFFEEVRKERELDGQKMISIFFYSFWMYWKNRYFTMNVLLLYFVYRLFVYSLLYFVYKLGY